MGSKFFIDPDITKAETMPASFYRDQEVFEKLKEKVFLKSWQWIGSDELVPLPNHVHPFVLLDHFLTEPMLLIRNASDQLSCLTNVCTHRGNIIANQPGKVTKLLCAYHGRRFSQNGTFEFMPEFQQAQDFPRACDDLHKFELKSLGPHLFVGMRPKFDFDSVLKVMESRIGFLPLDQFKFESVLSKDYLINAIGPCIVIIIWKDFIFPLFTKILIIRWITAAILQKYMITVIFRLDMPKMEWKYLICP